MKKFIVLLTMITCILGLTACGGKDTLTLYEQQKVSTAVSVVTEEIIPCIMQINENPEALAALKDYNSREVEAVIAQTFGLEVDGNSFISALDSFSSTGEEIGGVRSIKSASAEIDDKRIIVSVSVEGAQQDAEAEVILSNDFFFALESASLNKVETMGALMGKAGMNTLLGMGTVFAVLLLISAIISAFSLIPKIQKAFSKKKEDVRTAGIDNAVSQIAKQEEGTDASDDLELVAVIAAAVAASEGAAGTDGFVVRSIRRRAY